MDVELIKKLMPFTCNGEFYIWVKNSRVGRKTPNKQEVKQHVSLVFIAFEKEGVFIVSYLL